MSTIPKLYTFEQAIEAFFPNTGLGAGDLLSAYRKKRLRITKIGHTKLVSEDQIRAMIERCQGQPSEPDYGSNADPAETCGLSSTRDVSTARAALRKMLYEPGPSSKTSKPKITNPSAAVVQLKSR